MYLGIKPWLLGFENWAVPTRPAYHIGPFPDIVRDENYQYRLYRKSGRGIGCLGYLVASYVLGGEKMMKRNKKAIETRYPHFSVDRFWRQAIKVGRAEREWMLANQVRTFDELLENPPWESSLEE